MLFFPLHKILIKPFEQQSWASLRLEIEVIRDEIAQSSVCSKRRRPYRMQGSHFKSARNAGLSTWSSILYIFSRWKPLRPGRERTAPSLCLEQHENQAPKQVFPRSNFWKGIPLPKFWLPETKYNPSLGNTTQQPAFQVEPALHSFPLWWAPGPPTPSYLTLVNLYTAHPPLLSLNPRCFSES